MRGFRNVLLSGVALLAMLVVPACSRPSGPAEETKPASAAPPAAAPSNDAAPAASAAPATVPVEPAKPEKPAKTLAAASKAAAQKPAPPTTSQPAPPVQTAADAPPPAPLPAPLPAPAPLPETGAPVPVPTPPPPQPTTKQVTVPAGTQVYVRMIDSIASDTGHAGDTFRASLDSPIIVDGQIVAPKNSDVNVKLVEVQSAGKLKGTSELKVQLDRIFIGKKSYDITSNAYTQSGASEGKKAARNVGVGAAVGGILGGILGGKTGAVIGAGAGGGGGAAVSKGEQVRIDSETQLVFKLDNPLDVTLTLNPPGSSSNRSGSGGPAQLAPPRDTPQMQRQSSNSPGAIGNLTGTWTVTTNNTQNSMRLVLRQNGSNLQGSISNPMGGGTIQIQGTVDGNFVTFSTPQNSQYPMQYSGAISGDTMQGTVLLPVMNNGGIYGGGYPGGGYPGGGYPGGNRRAGSRGNATTQAHWSAQRAD